jgi:hypothetical protein
MRGEALAGLLVFTGPFLDQTSFNILSITQKRNRSRLNSSA